VIRAISIFKLLTPENLLKGFSYGAYFLKHKIKKIPFGTNYDLTWQCNLKSRHCYFRSSVQELTNYSARKIKFGALENFIYNYFIAPIWERSGYNIVNTIVYAVIAIASVYVLHRIIKKRVKIDRGFVQGVLAFVLLGSTMRVVTDAIDTGVFTPVTPLHQFILDSHIMDYGYLTVSPGIYIVTAALLLVSMVVLRRMKRMELLGYVGLLLWIPFFLLLIPFMQYAVFAIPILVLAAVPAYFAVRYFKDHVFSAIVTGQALDGAATFFVIDYFSQISGIKYFEQHVFSSFIGELFDTYFTFYLVKAAIALAAAHVLVKEKMDLEDKYYIALVLMIMGFAPGIRDILRMVIGG